MSIKTKKILGKLNIKKILVTAVAGFTLTLSSLSLIDVNAKEVSWLRYPAISPDGSQIAFNYKGDIYIVDSKGGNAKILTLSDAIDYNAVWSNDGKKIAYASQKYGNYDVFVVDVTTGESKRLTFHSSDDVPTCFSQDGKTVYFTSMRTKAQNSMQFNQGRIPELYSVSVSGGSEKQVSTIGIENAQFNKQETIMVFHDKKGYEDPFRKHQVSPIARDIWLNETKSNKYYKLTDFEGEDRNPLFSADEKSLYYLSEKDGTFNVWKMGIPTNLNDKVTENIQVTKFAKHPVRFLTISNDETLCFSFDGNIYTKKGTSEPVKLNINIQNEDRVLEKENKVFASGATEMDISPNGKEVVFVVRGEVFVTSNEGSTTKRITNTQTQERSVSFSPDGRSILYAAEKNGIWGIYQTSLTRDDETFFYNATVLKETPLVITKNESFQPKYSPDGKEIAFIENRTGIKVYNIASGKTREVLPSDLNYSYSDGDQWFDWSPDSKYLLTSYISDKNWSLSQVGLIDVNKQNSLVNLTQSGYENEIPKWSKDGDMMIWFTTKDGMKNHGSHGWESDVYAMFFNQKAYDKFKMSKEDFTMLKDAEEIIKKSKKDKEDKTKTDKKSKKDNQDEKNDEDLDTNKEIKVNIELDNISDRKLRLTVNSSNLADAILSPDNENLYYLTSFEGGNDLWVNKLRTKETKLLMKLGAGSVSEMKYDKDGKFIYLVADGRILKINPETADQKNIGFSAQMEIDYAAEREYMFEHAWREAREKFYVSNLHNVDWDFYKKEYAKFLPYINNNKDFAELLSELLGELNASHTGGRFFSFMPNADATASLGVFYDETYSGKGVKVLEVVEKSPFTKAGSKVKAGTIIEKIDGIEINAGDNIYVLLNRKAGTNILISAKNGAEAFDEVVKPIADYQWNELLYQRWIKKQQEETEKISGGRVGYMHVRGMDNASFRDFYEKVMGKYASKEAIIVDTRNNGGGWLHDDLATFLSGKKYIDFVPRERYIGSEPRTKWTKPSVVLMSEGNYSDAHMFPYTYKALGIGKLIGMPVAGTGTAVWWERMQDPTMVFGIPQVGIKGMDGKYLENQTLYPDIQVKNTYESINEGRDLQLEAAVKELLKEIDKK